jgi:hypothetical protein
MTISRKIFFIATFSLTAATGTAQVTPSQEITREVKLNKTETRNDTRNTSVSKFDNQKQNSGDKIGSVKQVKSARPDMSKSRGARPPDIVRPSGSRIPKGVGRPAGAGRHGRG